LAVASCTIITELQIPYWRDNEALFRRATVATTDNFLAYNSLGAALYSKGRFDEATAAYRASLASYPGYSDARHNLIAILIRTGQLDEAASQITEGKKFRVDFANLHYSLGLALRDRGRTDESILQLSEALALSPDNPGAHSALGALLVRKGRTTKPSLTCKQSSKTSRRFGSPSQSRPRVRRQRTHGRRHQSVRGSATPATRLRRTSQTGSAPHSSKKAAPTKASPTCAKPSKSAPTSPTPTTTSAPPC